MRSRILATVVMLFAASSPRSVTAQTMVTFEVPVKLTQLSPELQKISLQCQIKSEAIVAPVPGQVIGTDEVPVVGGQVITTMRVVITLDATALKAPVGKPASYTCDILGRTATGLGGFTDTAQNPVYQLKPTPVSLTGTFVW